MRHLRGSLVCPLLLLVLALLQMPSAAAFPSQPLNSALCLSATMTMNGTAEEQVREAGAEPAQGRAEREELAQAQAQAQGPLEVASRGLPAIETAAATASSTATKMTHEQATPLPMADLGLV